MPIYDLKIAAVEARNIAGLDKSGTSDPYCVIKNSFNKQTFKTKVVKKSISPKWGQEFTFFTSKPEGEVHIKLWDRKLLTKDKPLGEIMLSLDKFADGKEHDEWFQLVNVPPLSDKKKQKNPTTEPAEVRVKVHFVGLEVKDKKDGGKEEIGTNSEKNKEQAPKKESKPDKPVSIEDKYDLGKIIGRGAFSVVKEGIRKASGKKYAIKCISKKLIDKKELSLLEREIDIMKKLQHPNIIQLMEVIDTPDTLFLVLEYVSGGELFDSIVNKGSYSEIDAAKIVRQILEAIRYVHSNGIAHRDLKPENLLLSGEGKEEFVKIADFGLSKDFGQEQLQTSCGTPDYVAPEVLMGEPYDMSVDLWSIGVICYVLLCGFPPFYGETQKELFENIMSGTFDFPDPEWSDVSDAAKHFIQKILVVNPNERYTAEEALDDPWMKESSEPTSKKIQRLQSFSVQKFKEYNQKYKEANNTPQKPIDD